MRILFCCGWALLLLTGTVPVTTYPTTQTQTKITIESAASHSLNSARNFYINSHRGNSFIRFRPNAPSVPQEITPAINKGILFNADTSLNGQWFLQPVLPSDTANGEFPSLKFNLTKKTFSGHTGCNTMQGSFQLTDSSFSFNDNLRLTRKVCSGYNEGAFLKNLFMANRYTIRDSVLTLWFDQTELSHWTRKPQRGLVIKSA